MTETTNKVTKTSLEHALLKAYDRLKAESPVPVTIRPAAQRLNVSTSRLQRALAARKLAALNDVPLNGDSHLPAIRPSQPIAIHRNPSQPIATTMDDLAARVATLEAFMAAVQAEHRSPSLSIAPASQPIAVHRSEPPAWVSRGLQVSADMLEAIDAYAQRYRLEKREVLDLALRRFFAAEGER